VTSSSTGATLLAGVIFSLYAGGMLHSCVLEVKAPGLQCGPDAANDDDDDDPMAMTESAAALLAMTLIPRLLTLYVAAATPTALSTTCSVNCPASLPYLNTHQSV